MVKIFVICYLRKRYHRVDDMNTRILRFVSTRIRIVLFI